MLPRVMDVVLYRSSKSRRNTESENGLIAQIGRQTERQADRQSDLTKSQFNQETIVLFPLKRERVKPNIFFFEGRNYFFFFSSFARRISLSLFA